MEASQHVFHLSQTTATAASLQRQRHEVISNQMKLCTHSHNENKTGCTFESGNLPRLCFGQAFLTGVSGQCQRDAAAAQQKADLLTSRILGEQREYLSKRSTTKNRKIQNNFEKGCAEGMWELLME